MRFFKTLWGFLFRLFPCPTSVGLRRIGNPGADSPVLVTCNFHLTVKRLAKVLRHMDVWLLVADSKGVNVWCAAGAEEFNTHSVASVVKTSGIEDMVNHRTLILPPLGAPGVKAADVRAKTGWKTKWGPVYAKDIPRYKTRGFRRDESMKRVRYDLKQRLDTGIGSLFPFYFLGAVIFFIFFRGLLFDYLVAGAAAFLAFLTLCPWIPGKRGITKAILCDTILLAILLTLEFLPGFGNHIFCPFLIIAMVMIPVYALELGGIASTMKSDLDPFLARRGIGAIGNISFAGTVRTELLNGYRVLTCNHEICSGCRTCTEVCPQGVWQMGRDKRAEMVRKDACTACRACLVQCETGAIQALRVKPGEA